MFEPEFYALLAGDADLQALLGNSDSPAATRLDGTTGIFAALLPEEAPLPALEWAIVSDQGMNALNGVNRTGHKRVEVSVYADGYLPCKQVAAAVSALLAGFNGALAQGGYLSSVIRQSVSDVFEEEPRVFRAILEFSLMYTDNS